MSKPKTTDIGEKRPANGAIQKLEKLIGSRDVISLTNN